MGWNPVDTVGNITKGLVPGQKDYLDFGGSPTSDDTSRPKFKKKSTQDLLDAIQIGESTGVGNTDYLKKILARRGLTYEGAQAGDIDASFDPNDPSEVDFTDAQKILGKTANGRKSIQIQKWEAFKAELLDKKMRDYFDTNVQPTFDRVNTQLNEMLSKAAFSDEELGMVRSELSSSVRAQEASRLRKTAATLGIRGLDPGSAAGASIINRQIEETDAALTDALRRFGLATMEQERESQAKELGLSTALTQSMFGSKAALEEGNFERLYGINSEIGNILEAVNSLDATTKAANEAARLGFYGNVISGVAQGAGNAVPG